MPEKNLKEILEDYKEETKRHFDVVAERLEDKIGIISEQVAANTEKIGIISEQVAANTEKLEEHDQRFNKIDETLEIIKLDIEFIKNELKQKVSRDEFAALEKRVSLLEAKIK
jgi:DNA-binding ferritin-like protein